jgi:hypothetical protein
MDGSLPVPGFGDTNKRSRPERLASWVGFSRGMTYLLREKLTSK